MECLTNFIGLSTSCNAVPSTSGLNADDLEGISVKALASVESGKYLTAQAMVDRLMFMVGMEYKERIRELLGDAMAETAIESIIAKDFSDDYWDQEDGTPGLRIEKRQTALSNLFVPYIYFRSHTEVRNLEITITDGYNPVTYEIDAEADEVIQILVNYETKQNSIDITYSSAAGPSDTGVSPYKGSLSPWNRYGCNKCTHKGSHYIIMHGLDFDGEEVNEYYGIKADVMLACDTEKMICLIAQRYPMMFLYSLDSKLAKEWAASDRFNIFAMASKDWSAAKAIEWSNEAKQLWFDNGEAISRLLRSAESKCFTCTGISYTETTP